MLDSYPKRPAVIILNMQMWVLDADGNASDGGPGRPRDFEVMMSQDAEGLAEARRRVKLSYTKFEFNATAHVHREDTTMHDADAYVRAGAYYDATVVSMPHIIKHELIADDPRAAAKAWEDDRAARESNTRNVAADEFSNAELKHAVKGGMKEDEELEEETPESHESMEARRAAREHWWPIRGWCDDGKHPRAEYDEQGKHYRGWMVQALMYALRKADSVEQKLEGQRKFVNAEGDGALEEEDVVWTLPPLPQPLVEARRYNVGGTHCYRWDCGENQCPDDFHAAQARAPYLAPKVMYNSTHPDVEGGSSSGPADDRLWGWHHTQHPIHGKGLHSSTTRLNVNTFCGILWVALIMAEGLTVVELENDRV